MSIKNLKDNFKDIVAHANKAPSVHNIQPTKWHLNEKLTAIDLYHDSKRFLPIGDPKGKDVELSMGAAAEGTCISLSKYGFRVREVQKLKSMHYSLILNDGGDIDPLYDYVESRSTWRGKFVDRFDGAIKKNLLDLVSDDVFLITDVNEKNSIAFLNDRASLSFFRKKQYLKEMYQWMRFSKKHPQWNKDGLNADSLCLSSLEARLAKYILRPSVFNILDAVGLGRALISDRDKVNSSSAILIYHRPKDETYFESGRRFYRLWLEITRAGFFACPMAALVDDDQTSGYLKGVCGIGDSRRLIMTMRIGVVSHELPINKARLAPIDTCYCPEAD